MMMEMRMMDLWKASSPCSHQVFFLKTHRTGGSTLQNTFIRMAIRYNLSRYDVAFNHMVFNYSLVRAYMHPKAAYVTILRHPLARTMSAFVFFTEAYLWSYLVHIPGKVPLITYLTDPVRWEPENPGKSQTNNRMSFDLGLDAASLHDKPTVERFIKSVEDNFDLVMITEYFDESMVLLKRLLGWSTRDILYMRANNFRSQKEYYVSKDVQLENFERYQMADYMLYRHFHKVLEEKMEAAGDGFADEVAAFKVTLKRLGKFCTDTKKDRLVVRKTRWEAGFTMTRKDCLLVMIPEPDMMLLLRHVMGNGTKCGTLTEMTLQELLRLVLKLTPELDSVHKRHSNGD
nr:hypothetical protein BaRGS_015507 [Batillaria attramentaria]